jgi:hypothetical protein
MLGSVNPRPVAEPGKCFGEATQMVYETKICFIPLQAQPTTLSLSPLSDRWWIIAWQCCCCLGQRSRRL